MREGLERRKAPSKKTLIPLAAAALLGGSFAYETLATEVDSARLKSGRAKAEMVINGHDKVLSVLGDTSVVKLKKCRPKGIEPTSETFPLGNHQFKVGRSSCGDVLIHPDGHKYLVGNIDEAANSVQARLNSDEDD